MFTILDVYDGNYERICGFYDSSVILVEGLMTPEEVSRFEWYLRSEYFRRRKNVSIYQIAIDYLEEHSFKVLPTYKCKVNYSGGVE